MNATQISVIVALYNASQYLRQCIDNILSQTFQDFELLLVNDGSTDNTGEICDEYAKRDKRIRVFHEQHKGVWHSRQVGIDNASGEYSIHIDADDWALPNMLEEMYWTAVGENADILICDYIEETKQGSIYRCQRPTALLTEEVTEDIINRNGKLWGALWNKLIKTKCYRDNNVCFPEGMNMCEDSVTVCRLLEHRPRLSYLPKAFYHYDRTCNQSSLTNKYLNVSVDFYEQEIRYREEILALSQISRLARQKLTDELLNIAYITLHSTFFKKVKWTNTFLPFYGIFQNSRPLYKKWLVLWALEGHFKIARWGRNILVKTKTSYSKWK